MTVPIRAGWLCAGVVAAGVGGALFWGSAAASAAPDTDTARDSAPVRASHAARSAPRTVAATSRPVIARSALNGAVGGTLQAPGPLRAAVLAAQAYLYGYPLLEFERFRSQVPSLNTLESRPSFAAPNDVPIWRPNTDTFYSRAVLDLSEGPAVLSFPDMGDRYFSFQLNDPYTNVIGYIGSRTTGPGPGKYAITWDAGPQVSVDGAQVITVPDRNIMLLGRTLAGDAADQLQAAALMSQYTLTVTGPSVDPPPAATPPAGLAALDAISAAMERNPPPARDAAQLQAMAQIGVGPGMRIADAGLSPLSALAADFAVQTTAALLPLVAALTQLASAVVNRGWATPDSAIGDYGTNYALRAGVILVGPWANTPAEAVYSAGLLDQYLLPLTGSRSYVMHFAPGQEPPVGAFWSVTVYDGDGALVPNPGNLHSVSSSRPGELVRRPDGSIDIIFSRSDPQDPGANWLPVPAGAFSAYMRMYVPGAAVLDGTWTPPPIQPRFGLFG